MKTQTHFPNKSFRKITRIEIHTGYKTKLSTELVDIFSNTVFGLGTRTFIGFNKSVCDFTEKNPDSKSDIPA